MSLPRFTVAPTFDLDEMTVPIFEHRTRNWFSRGEFGARVGAPRILDTLKARDWQVTWFVPGHAIDTFPELCQRIVDEGHEIGHHGYCHEDIGDASESDERAILEKGIDRIEKLTGLRPRGYRAPYWRSSFRTQQLLDEYGFLYDSSLMADDFSPYHERTGDDLEKADPTGPYHFGTEMRLIQVPVAWHLDDWDHYELPSVGQAPLKSPPEVMAVWQAEFDFGYQRVPGGILNLTMHPEVTGRGGRLLALEGLLDAFAAMDGVHVGRIDEYVNAWLAEGGASGHR
ncbi:MAG: polysaccharide deacetylase family protein [Candidatus Limnocylindrales bacterium]